LVPYNLCVLF